MPNLFQVSCTVCSLGLFLVGCTGTRPTGLGARDGRLSPCPSTPNCVSSQSSDLDHAVEPIAYDGPRETALADLKKVLLTMPRVRIVAEQDGYLYAEFTSALLRFVDDVEFLVNEPLQRIEVRSASRLGRSDLGVNRKRVEEIRSRWKERSR